MEHHLQALVFIIYFVATILALYHVHQSRHRVGKSIWRNFCN